METDFNVIKYPRFSQGPRVGSLDLKGSLIVSTSEEGAITHTPLYRSLKALLKLNSIQLMRNLVGFKSWRRDRAVRRFHRNQTEANLPKRLVSARSIYTDLEVLRTLATDASPQVRQLVASNSSITKDIVKLLIEDDNQIVRFNLAQRLDLSEESVDRLTNDSSENVLLALALREKLTKKQQSALLNSGTGVRQKLALRKDLDESISKTLSNDDDPRVRVLLAAMTTSQKVIEKLENDESVEVRKVIAKRKGTFDAADAKWQEKDNYNKSALRVERDSWIRSLSKDLFKKNHEEGK